MSNSISFMYNGAGITWANNNSQIYDDSNLNIKTDDYLYVSCLTQMPVTVADSYFSGNLCSIEGIVASQTWVNNNF